MIKREMSSVCVTSASGSPKEAEHPVSQPLESDVMISYSWKACPEVVESVENSLLAKGLVVWRDKFRLKKGENYEKPIRDAAERARVMLVFLSEEYEASTNCLLEAGYAKIRVGRGQAVVVCNVGSADYQPHLKHEGSVVHAVANSTLWIDLRPTQSLAPLADERSRLWEAVSGHLRSHWTLRPHLSIGARDTVTHTDEAKLKAEQISPPLYEVDSLTIFVEGRSLRGGIADAVPVGWQWTWRSVSWNGERGKMVYGDEIFFTQPTTEGIPEKGWCWPALPRCFIQRALNRNNRTLDRVELLLDPGEHITSLTAASQAGQARGIFLPRWLCGPIFPTSLGYLRVETNNPAKVLSVGRLIESSSTRTIPHRATPNMKIFGFEGHVGWWLDNVSALLFEKTIV